MKINSKAEKWVGNTGMKRLTIDIEPDLHANFKSKVDAKGLNMKGVLIKFIKTYVQTNK